MLSGVAQAGSAPKELYGKSITMAWSEARTMRFESEQLVRNTGTAVQICIRTSGRPFVRVISHGFAGHGHHEQLGGWPSALTEAAPGKAAKDHVDFGGRSIVVYRQFRSGARRVNIDLDGTTCKAKVVNGREGGKNIEQYSNRFGEAEVLSVQVEP
jgi:hypothetical protein